MTEGAPTPITAKSLGEVWRMYTRLFLDPIQAERIQRQETRRAFYAGAQAVITIISNNLSEDQEPTEADFAMIDSIAKELADFRTAVEQRRA